MKEQPIRIFSGWAAAIQLGYDFSKIKIFCVIFLSKGNPANGLATG
jgi:hypothetical protein